MLSQTSTPSSPLSLTTPERIYTVLKHLHLQTAASFTFVKCYHRPTSTLGMIELISCMDGSIIRLNITYGQTFPCSPTKRGRKRSRRSARSTVCHTLRRMCGSALEKLSMLWLERSLCEYSLRNGPMLKLLRTRRL